MKADSFCDFPFGSQVIIISSEPNGDLLSNDRMDEWITCDFTSFSTVFQSYQDDGMVIMKGCVQWARTVDH